MPWCGSRWVPPGTASCPDGSRPTENRNGEPGAAAVTPGEQKPPTQTTGKPSLRPPAQADTRPVVTSAKPPAPGLPPEAYMVSDVYTERDNLNTMRVTDPQRYSRIINELRQTGLLGPRANSESSIDNAYKKLLQAAAGAYAKGSPVTPQQARNILVGAGDGGDGPGGGRSRGGRAPAYDGPMESVQVAAETDIVAMAQATAQELLGRSATQKELDKILKRTRKAEQTQPTVQTRQGPGRVTTEEGLTKEGRDAILKKVLMQSPDYASYQFDSTVMDMMMDNLRRGQQVARG
jgi:hypothetical protein